MPQKTIYIVGPALNGEQLLHDARVMLKRKGHTPADAHHYGEPSLTECDGVAILPGIPGNDPHANPMLRLARQSGIEIKTIYQWIE